jgi:hypothetical protein
MLIKRGHGSVRIACENAIDKTYQLNCNPILDEIRRKLIAASSMSDREGVVALNTIIQGFVLESCADLKNKIHMFEQRITRINQQIQKPTPTIEELIEEIKSVRANFPSLRMSGNRVKVTTDNIILSDGDVEVEFGKFDLVVFLNRILSEGDEADGLSSIIQAKALSPNQHPEDSATTHPHVQDNVICLGDGYPPIVQAFQQGRLEDVFRLLTTLLKTYNSDSPHHPLESWEGYKCESCGFAPANEHYSCNHCGSEMCEECRTSCADCSEKYCNECLYRCEGCEEIICHSCSSECNGCGDVFCTECIRKCDCGVSHCEECQERCTSCDEKICEDCMVICKNCGTGACEECIITCKNCKNDFCKACYDEDDCSLLKKTTEKSKT